MNDKDIKRQIRKQKDILATFGYGVAIFVLWAIVKGVIYLRDIGITNKDFQNKNFIFIFILISCVEAAISISTGLLAIREGKKDHKPHMILRVLAVFLSLMSIVFVLEDVLIAISLGTYEPMLTVSFIADIGYTAFAILIAISSIWLLKLYKQDKEEQ